MEDKYSCKDIRLGGSATLDSISRLLIEIKLSLCAFLVWVYRVGKPWNSDLVWFVFAPLLIHMDNRLRSFAFGWTKYVTYSNGTRYKLYKTDTTQLSTPSINRLRCRLFISINKVNQTNVVLSSTTALFGCSHKPVYEPAYQLWNSIFLF